MRSGPASVRVVTTALVDQPTLVVEQIRKVFELRNQYRIFDESGDQVGAVEQERQSSWTFLFRLGTDLDVALPVTLNIADASGSTVLVVHKPWFRMTVQVSRPDGSPVGTIRKRIRMGKARFTITADGREVGEVRAESWRARDFAVVDAQDTEVARAAKEWRGLATEMFTDADTYVVRIQPDTSEPLRSLALAASLTIDLVLKQKDY